MAFQLFSLDTLNNIMEEMSLYKPETPELKPLELETLNEIYLV